MNGDYHIYINNNEFRKEVEDNNVISSHKLADEQVNEIPNYGRDVYGMVAECFTNVSRAATLLSANGMFLKYAGPTIRSNYHLVKIAVNQNGNALEYAGKELLMSDPKIAADLILSTVYGQPCEAFRKVIKDSDYIFEVCKKIIEIDPDMLNWVASKMYGIESYEKYQQKLAELLEFRKNRNK